MGTKNGHITKMGGRDREQRAVVSTGLDLPIYELNFTNRWTFSFLGRGRFNEGPQCVLFKESFPAQVLNSRSTV